MKKIIFLTLGLFSLLSCDFNKEEREKTATRLANTREQIQTLEEEIISTEENDLANAEKELNYLNTTATYDINNLYDGINEFHLFRTEEDKQEQLTAYQRQVEELKMKKETAIQNIESIKSSMESKREEIKRLKDAEIEYQKQLDMLK